MKLKNPIAFLQSLMLTLLFSQSVTIISADDSQWRFTTPEQIISVGDIHGDFNAFVSIMKKANLIDSDNDWIGGKKHFVNTGDFLDRGPDSRKVMDLFMKIEQQAAKVGGKIHVLLGNHEAMVLTGDRRYVAKKEYATYINEDLVSDRQKAYRSYLSIYGLDDNQQSQNKFNSLHPPGFLGLHAEFKDSGYYGKWLKDKPFMIIINQKVFTHGGLSKTVGELGLEGINDKLNREMNDYAKLWYKFIEDGFFLHSFQRNELLAISNALIKGRIKKDRFTNKRFIKKVKRFLKLTDSVVSKPESPLWYRGTALCHQFSEEPMVNKVLKQLNASSAYLGHNVTNSREVESRFNARVFLQDTGMFKLAYGGQASLVVHNITHNAHRVQVLDADHGIHDIKEQLPRIWRRPYGMTNEQLENFLLTAQVVESEEVDEGITKPIKLTLKKGNRTIYAVYKSIDTNPSLERKNKWPHDGNNSDRYNHEMAAYELNKMLGLDIIPPTVVRSYKAKKGIFQFWISNAINRSKMITDKVTYAGSCSKSSQMALMKIFDALIYNDDRNTGNVLFQQDEWQIWLIDHTRAFVAKSKIPKVLKWNKLTLSNSFRKSLENLDEQLLKKRLSKYLHKRQISYLIKRKNKILARL